ncbi:hypothetical protein [Nonomuraea sp. B19D2]|uniref:hypothetical protein n=1 Tax=Nonomuraea sp. B19D2 TaxID=3159561 RepID=UPI0032DB674E
MTEVGLNPAQASTQSVCVFCSAAIVKAKYGGMVPTEHWDAVEPEPGVLFAMECPSRPLSGMSSGSFGNHQPR